MPIHRLNHAVLYVRDLERSVAFYRDVLGFRRVDMTPEGFRGAAFIQAPGSTNDHDLGLFEIGAGAGPSAAGRQTVGLYHLAWEVDTLAELERLATRLGEAGALVGASDHGTTKSLYA
ncbi:MAG TPA: VOC family protein, partial [Actinomycetota bacterium]|nr:VOC family protein [Actinomycetota bacterium]